MIYASLNAKKGNYQYPAAIATALEFLAKPETAELPVGRYELDGDNIFVLIQDQTTRAGGAEPGLCHRRPGPGRPGGRHVAKREVLLGFLLR